MKNPTYSIKNVQPGLTIDYSAQIVNSYRPIVTEYAKQLLKKISKIVMKENLQTGMLHLFFGEATANVYNQGNSRYYESFYPQMPTVLTEWLLLQLLKTDNTLSGELFTAITHATSTIQKHVERLSALGTVSPLVVHTAFFPALCTAPFKGIINGLKASYYPYPGASTDTHMHTDTISSLLVWALNMSKQRMLVSLHDASDLETLQELQTTRHTEHQLKILNAITQGYEDVFTQDPNTPNTFIPGVTIRTRISYDGIRFCSYETFSHLSDSNGLENIPFAATNILNQLNSDYLHHGLTLSEKELALFLKLYLSRLSPELMTTEASVEDLYKTALGRLILQQYISEDQVQHIVRHHTMLNAEKNERREWHCNIAKVELPPRLQTRIKKMVIPFNEMYAVTLNNRKEFFNDLEPLYNQSGYSFDGYFSGFARLLLDVGCNVKYVSQAYERFVYNKNYLCRYPFSVQKQHYTLDLRFLHDFYAVLHPTVIRFFDALKQHNEKKEAKKVSNIILKSILSYNLNTSAHLTHLAKLLNALSMKLEKSILMQKEVLLKINQQSSISTILALCEDRELQIDNIVLHTIKHTLHVKGRHLKMASNMMVKESYVDLCSDLSNSIKYPLFHMPNDTQECMKERVNFNVGIFAHNNPIALLGPSLSSVCINSASVYHHQQLNSSFMNLCVYDDEQLILWGLLCRAHKNNNETVYILNNFQGSINNKHINAKDVRAAIIDLLKEFIEMNNIDVILLKDQCFNTVNLCEGQPSMQTVPNRLILERNARLDFEVNSQGVVQQEKFYVLDILKEVS